MNFDELKCLLLEHRKEVESQLGLILTDDKWFKLPIEDSMPDIHMAYLDDTPKLAIVTIVPVNAAPLMIVLRITREHAKEQNKLLNGIKGIIKKCVVFKEAKIVTTDIPGYEKDGEIQLGDKTIHYYIANYIKDENDE